MSFARDMLRGRVALVTGAAHGAGAAIAQGLAAHGARTVLVDIDRQALAARCAELRGTGADCYGFLLDVGSDARCREVREQILEAVGRLYILVNNAGVRPRHDFDAADRDRHWRRTMDVNLDGIRRMALLWRDELSRSRGAVINVTSIAAFNASPGSIAYSTSKAAAGMLTKALAGELAAEGVRVNAVAPGVLETEMTQPSRDDPRRREWLMARIPMARFGRPDELVGAVLFLASETASYVTGATIRVDGGYLAI